jgi:hypothetical protein
VGKLIVQERKKNKIQAKSLSGIWGDVIHYTGGLRVIKQKQR